MHPVRSTVRAATPRPIRKIQQGMHPVGSLTSAVTIAALRGGKGRQRPRASTNSRGVIFLIAIIVVAALFIASAVNKPRPASSTTSTTTAVPALTTTLLTTGAPTPLSGIDTAQFTVGSDWYVAWSAKCSDGVQTVTVQNGDGSLATELPIIEGINGESGVQHYTQSGTYKLDVYSNCPYTVRVGTPK